MESFIVRTDFKIKLPLAFKWKFQGENVNKNKIKILSDEKALCHNLLVSVFSFMLLLSHFSDVRVCVTP